MNHFLILSDTLLDFASSTLTVLRNTTFFPMRENGHSEDLMLTAQHSTSTTSSHCEKRTQIQEDTESTSTFSSTKNATGSRATGFKPKSDKSRINSEIPLI